MVKTKKLVLLGDSAFAEIAYEYFTHDSEYEVAAFSVEREYLRRDELFGVPVVPFEELPERFAPGGHEFYAALVYTQGNTLRRRLYEAAKAKGYRPASYVSPHAFVWRNARIGEHCFIFENNVVQPFVTIGDDVVLWSGNHIGHHSKVGDHCFVSSHVVVSGFVEVGHSCFLGVNATVANNTKIGDRCTVGAGAVVLGDVGDNETVVGVWKRRRPVVE
ncbi:MAG TPA: acetyltransferase [Thermoanaerobaculia bacterium]|jgi:sugar O-acyltransferase (sialic acid O-acetyltransferase NeuD family)|nr:acetyltransferase [Thermoanaerobaculia bacterium]